MLSGVDDGSPPPAAPCGRLSAPSSPRRQVYKAELRDGRQVAVKVQRPQILDEIALDLYLLRLLTPLQTRISNFVNKVPTFPEDIQLAEALVDEWGRGFVAETDYLYEAANTKEFSAAMRRRNLGAVTSPTVVDEFSTSCVLVTEWIDGTRLDLDASPDVPRLCGVAINAYLTMLLDTGTLHCDPHPGNLLRTRDGKLCILDWGMTQAVPEDLQYSLIEFIAHVNAEDYDAMPADFVNLGFTPPEQLERVRASNLTEGLSFVLRQLSQGGGGKKLQARVREEWAEKYDAEGRLTQEELRERVREDFYAQARQQLEADGVEGASVMDVQNVMEQMQQRNRDLFKVTLSHTVITPSHRQTFTPVVPSSCRGALAPLRRGAVSGHRPIVTRGRPLSGAAVHPLRGACLLNARGHRSLRQRRLLDRERGLPLPLQTTPYRPLATRQGRASFDGLRVRGPRCLQRVALVQ